MAVFIPALVIKNVTQNNYLRVLHNILLVAGFVLLGIAWSAWMAASRLSDHLPQQWEGKDIQVTGVVASLPQSFERGVRAVIEVEDIETPLAIVPRRVRVSWYHSSGIEPQWMAGQRWRLTLRLKRPHGNANPHAFDYEAWLLEHNIRASGYVRHNKHVAAPELLAAMVWRPGYIVDRLRQRLRQRFYAALPLEKYPYSSILAALAIGDQRSISNEMWRVFRRTGVIHLLSVSGLHVTMIAALFGALVSVLWRRIPPLVLRVATPRAAIVGGWGMAFVYTLMAGFAVPTQRTLYMLSVAAISLLTGRNLGAARTLALALFVVLLLDPWAVLSPGFWLSFGAVAALFYVGAAMVSPAPGPVSIYLRLKLTVAAWGLTQWTASLASLPVLLLLFQQFSLISPFANAIAIPWISLLITPLSLVAAVLPWQPLLELLYALLTPLINFLIWCSKAPQWYAPSPPWWAFASGIIGVVVMLLPRGLPGRGFGVFLLLPVLFWQPPKLTAGTFRMTMLDVGQGMAVAIETSAGVTLYDTGPRYGHNSDAGGRVVLPWLQAIGVKRINTLIVSHPDSDHAGGFASIMAALPVERVINAAPAASSIGLDGRCQAGQKWEEGGVRFQILHPLAADYDTLAGNRNSLSCVLLVKGQGGSLLLTSDIDAASEKRLLLSGAPLKAQVISVPHHGSKTSSLPEFISATEAKDALIPVGYRSRYGHPHSQVLERYAGRRLWRTDLHGAIQVDFGLSSYRVSAWRETRQRYWQGR